MNPQKVLWYDNILFFFLQIFFISQTSVFNIFTACFSENQTKQEKAAVFRWILYPQNTENTKKRKEPHGQAASGQVKSSAAEAAPPFFYGKDYSTVQYMKYLYPRGLAKKPFTLSLIM